MAVCNIMADAVRNHRLDGIMEDGVMMSKFIDVININNSKTSVRSYQRIDDH